MLPVKRWPRLIWKTILMIVAPQRVAWAAEMHVEKLWSISRRQHAMIKESEQRRNEQVNALLTQRANERRDDRERHQAIVDQMKEQFAQAIGMLEVERRNLADESSRLAEAKQKVAVLEGSIEVKDTQIELQATTIAKFIEKESGEARVHSLRGQKPDQEASV
jgi:hypothetical protein